MQSNYRLAGWTLAARFSDVFGNSELPSFLTHGESSLSDTDSKTFAATANHKLPLNGSGSFGYGYTNFSGDDRRNAVQRLDQ